MRTGQYVKAECFTPSSVVSQPLPQSRRAEYYDRLTAIRTDADWEGWLKFFLRGVYEVSQSATATAHSILDLREENRQAIGQQMFGSNYGLRLLDLLFQQPIVNVRIVEEYLQCAYVTASKIVDQFVALGLLEEITGWQRNRLYRYKPYLDLFEQPMSTVTY